MQQDPVLDALGVFLKQQALCSSSNGSKDAKQQTACICSLLCCSTEVASVVHAACRGTLTASLHVKHKKQQVEATCRWLAKHAQLLRCLRFKQHTGRNSSTVEGAVAAALTAAAAATAPLPLAELHCRSPISGRLLRPFSSSSSLTSLTLTLTDSKRRTGGLSASLAALTALQSLNLTPAPYPAPQPIPVPPGHYLGSYAGGATIKGRAFVSSISSGLSGLSQLTRLQLAGWTLLGPDDVAQLPVSLRSLSIHRRMGDDGDIGLVRSVDSAFDPVQMADPLEAEDLPLVPMDLSPLTNLTQLSFFQLCSWDRLPESLLSLDLDTPYGSIHKLTALTQLQELRLSDFFEAGTADLLDVAEKLSDSLHTLRLELENPYGLTYGGGEFVPWPNPWLESGAQYFGGLKCLKEVRLSGYYIQPDTILKLLSSTSLTHLSLTECSLAAEDTEGDMNWGFNEWSSRRALARHIRACARGLSGLKALQELELDLEIQTDFEPGHGREEEGDGDTDSEALTDGSGGTEWTEVGSSEGAEAMALLTTEERGGQIAGGPPPAAAAAAGSEVGGSAVGGGGGGAVGGRGGGAAAPAGEVAGGKELTSTDIQPLVDAIASLRPGLRELRLWLGRGDLGHTSMRVLLLSESQKAQLQL